MNTAPQQASAGAAAQASSQRTGRRPGHSSFGSARRENRLHRSRRLPLRCRRGGGFDAIATALLGGLLLLGGGAGAAAAAERCPGAETTLALRECLGRRLQDSDQALAVALRAVAAEAGRELPDEPFGTLWRQLGEQLGSGGDPARQLRSFQQARRQICLYINAMSLQGSGYGVFVVSCELDLNDTLLEQVRN